MKLTIRKLSSAGEEKRAALLISQNEPWKSYGRDIKVCHGMVTGETKQVYGGFAEDGLIAVIIFDMNGALAGYIQTVCVDEAYRGMRIGTKMIDFAESIIFKVLPNAFVCYSDIDERPGALYKKLGYELVGNLHDYNIRGHDEILLRKSVAPKSEFYNKK